jgi:hypothetical protein
MSYKTYRSYKLLSAVYRGRDREIAASLKGRL